MSPETDHEIVSSPILDTTQYDQLMEHTYCDDQMNDRISERHVLFPNLLTPEQCDQAIEMFNCYEPTAGGVGMNGTTYEYSRLRQCEVTYVGNNDHTKWVHDICEAAMVEANKVWNFDIRDFSQPMRMMDYRAGDHFGSWHQDHGPGKTCYRKLTIVVQLSDPDDYEGGMFEIAGGEVPEEYHQNRGAAIVFPTYYYHRVDPITSGRRRTIVHRAIGPHFR